MHKISAIEGDWIGYQTDPGLLDQIKKQKVEFLLHVWGISGVGKRTLNGHHWFDTESARDEFRKTKVLPAMARGKTGAMNTDEGRIVRARVKAEVLLRLPSGEEHTVHHDFEYGYSPGAARYMFIDGNRGCDCNRSIMLREIGVDIPEYPCGEKIKTVSVKVTLDWGGGKVFEVIGLEREDLFADVAETPGEDDTPTKTSTDSEG